MLKKKLSSNHILNTENIKENKVSKSKQKNIDKDSGIISLGFKDEKDRSSSKQEMINNDKGKAL
jgi:hypothetical protein